MSLSAELIHDDCISGPQANEIYCMRSPRSRTCICAQVHETAQPASCSATHADLAWSGTTTSDDTFSAPEPIHPQSFLPQRPTLSYTGSKEKLNHATMHRSFDTEYPVVPSRPPLKPTISFGGVSNVSYYSTASHSLEQKSKDVALEEELRSSAHAPIRSCKTYLCIIILYLLSFICGLNITFLATALPVLAHHLDLSAVQSFWIVNGYLLTSTLVQPLFMRLSSIAGVTSVLIFGLGVWMVGSMVSALSGIFSVLLVGRILSGAGAGVVGVLIQLIQNQLVNTKEPSKYERAISLTFWLGASLGPVIGGAIAQTADWHYMFYINVPFLAIGIVGIPFLLQLPRTGGQKLSDLLRIDYFGWTLLAGSISTLIIAISWAGTTYPWTSWHTLLPCIIGLVVLCFWMLYSKCGTDPILPISIFRKADVRVWCFGAMVHGMAFISIVYLMPYFFAIAPGHFNPSISGATVGLWTFALLIMSLVAGLASVVNAHRWTICFVWLFVTTGFGLMQLFQENAMLIYIPVGLATGLALGMLLPRHNAAIQHCASSDDETIYAAPLHNFFNSLGHTLGIAIGSGILLNRLQRWKETLIPLANNSHIQASNIVQMAYVMQQKPKHQAAFEAKLRSSYVDSLHWVWAVMCILAAVMLMLSICYTRGKQTRQLPPTNSV